MNLKDAYLCPSCNEIFRFDYLERFKRIRGISTTQPTCPICGNCYNLSLFRVLNRQEVKHETLDKHSISSDICIPAHVNLVDDPSGSSIDNPEKHFTGSSNQSGNRGSRPENDGGNSASEQTNRDIRTIVALVDVLGKLFQTKRNIEQELPRAHANPMAGILERCECIDRSQNHA